MNNLQAQVENNFTYHKPHGDQPQRYEGIRAAGKQLAQHVLATTPASREQSLALTKIEEAIFWANAAVARNEKEPPVAAPVEPAAPSADVEQSSGSVANAA